MFSVVDVVIPALNEEAGIAKVLQALPATVRQVVVADNGSTDATAEVAARLGAVVVHQPMRGYGSACLKALDYVAATEPLPEVVAFIDADFSDRPSELKDLLRELHDLKADLVIGSRALGKAERGSLTLPQRFGNWLSTRLLYLFYGVKFTDLGPFRVIRWPALQKLRMADLDYGWTVEMQIKAAKAKLNCSEVPVSYRNRIGVSKVSGTVKGAVLAGYKILYMFWKLRKWQP
jgi:glycosyltransferase involved in cell wall biosynthesis